MPSISCSGIGAGSPSNEMMFTTPVHLRIGRRSRGSNLAKQYPGNSGQSIFFFRSFQRLHRVTVGRNASTCFCSSCSRTTCSWRDRVHSAYHRASAALVISRSPLARSEERRVGKECRERRSSYHEEKKNRHEIND